MSVQQENGILWLSCMASLIISFTTRGPFFVSRIASILRFHRQYRLARYTKFKARYHALETCPAHGRMQAASAEPACGAFLWAHLLRELVYEQIISSLLQPHPIMISCFRQQNSSVKDSEMGNANAFTDT